MADELDAMKKAHDQKVAELKTQNQEEVAALVAKLADAVELVKKTANEKEFVEKFQAENSGKHKEEVSRLEAELAEQKVTSDELIKQLSQKARQATEQLEEVRNELKNLQRDLTNANAQNEQLILADKAVKAEEAQSHKDNLNEILRCNKLLNEQ